MSRRNITKFSIFVTLILSAAFFAAGCTRYLPHQGDSGGSGNLSKTSEGFSAAYGKPEITGRIDGKEIDESSGLAASRCSENVLWTHNDSGGKEFIFALDSTGKKLATYRLANAKNRDWEDMAAFKNAAGECFLFIADIGDNDSEKSELRIYKIKEPAVSSKTDSNIESPLLTESAEVIKFAYADGAHDAETLLIHPATGDIYILTKKFDAPAGVYKLAADYKTDSLNRLEKIADIKVPAVPHGLLTAGDIAPDGKSVVLCDYSAGYEIKLPDSGSPNFDLIWRENPVKFDLGERAQGEAVAYSADGKAIYATSEKLDSPLIKVQRK